MCMKTAFCIKILYLFLTTKSKACVPFSNNKDTNTYCIHNVFYFNENSGMS